MSKPLQKPQTLKPDPWTQTLSPEPLHSTGTRADRLSQARLEVGGLGLAVSPDNRSFTITLLFSLYKPFTSATRFPVHYCTIASATRSLTLAITPHSSLYPHSSSPAFSGLTASPSPPTWSRAFDRRPARAPVRFRIWGLEFRLGLAFSV